jgi:hypothetical protein
VQANEIEWGFCYSGQSVNNPAITTSGYTPIDTSNQDNYTGGSAAHCSSSLWYTILSSTTNAGVAGTSDDVERAIIAITDMAAGTGPPVYPGMPAFQLTNAFVSDMAKR